MHIVAHRPQIPIPAAVHNQGFVTPAEQVPEELVSPIEAAGKGSQEPFHSGGEVGLRVFDDQVKVIAHQTIRMHLPASLRASPPKFSQEPPAIYIIFEN